MALKESFASVLKALRGKRNISQYQFGDDASRSYLSKLEAKLDQLSQRL